MIPGATDRPMTEATGRRLAEELAVHARLCRRLEQRLADLLAQSDYSVSDVAELCGVHAQTIRDTARALGVYPANSRSGRPVRLSATAVRAIRGQLRGTSPEGHPL